MDLEIQRGGAREVSERPVYLQIADQIRRHVQSGRMADGERLPPIRALAKQLGVNRDTVSVAYELLAREGLVVSTVGRGTFVSLPRRDAVAPRDGAAPPVAPLVERLLEFERARPSYGAPDGAIPFHSLTPDPSLYPVKAFRRSMNRVLAQGGTELLIYGEHRGNGALREVIAERLAGHGIEAAADRIVLCQGASQGIALALRLYTEPGDQVAVEEPTYHNLLGVLVGLGLRPAPIPMTGEGPDLEALERVLARPEVKLFYTMPSFHNPMGISTSLAHRIALLELTARLGKPVVEDGFEIDLRYEGRPVPPLAALDRAGLVVHLFSFSKSLFPGVRVGAITAGDRAVDGLSALKRTTDLSGVLALQAAVADLVRSGVYDRHLGRLRRTLRARRGALLEGLAREMPDGSGWTRPLGGYQVWLELPEGIETRALLLEARSAGVMFTPGCEFYHDGRASRGLRLCFALPDVEQIRRGARALGALARAHLASRSRPARDHAIHV